MGTTPPTSSSPALSLEPDRIAAPVTLPSLIVTFRATGYRVDIGPALGIYLNQRLPSSVADVWVTDFDAICKPTEGQWPRHICTADYTAHYKLNGHPQFRRDVEIIEAGSATDDKAAMIEQADLLALALAEQIVRNLGM